MQYLCSLHTVEFSDCNREDFNLEIGVEIDRHLATLHFPNIAADAMVIGVHKVITIASYDASSGTDGGQHFLTFPVGGGKANYYAVSPLNHQEGMLLMTGTCVVQGET